jgi:hypothetical protein
VITIANTATTSASASTLTMPRTSVSGVAAGDGNRARTGLAARVRLLVDQQLRDGADEDERVR